MPALLILLKIAATIGLKHHAKIMLMRKIMRFIKMLYTKYLIDNQPDIMLIVADTHHFMLCVFLIILFRNKLRQTRYGQQSPANICQTF